MWKFEHTRITLARESRSLTQLELQGLTGISQTQISAWECGDVRPGQDSLTKLCNAMQIVARFFFVRTSNESNLGNEAQ